MIRISRLSTRKKHGATHPPDVYAYVYGFVFGPQFTLSRVIFSRACRHGLILMFVFLPHWHFLNRIYPACLAFLHHIALSPESIYVEILSGAQRGYHKWGRRGKAQTRKFCITAASFTTSCAPSIHDFHQPYFFRFRNIPFFSMRNSLNSYHYGLSINPSNQKPSDFSTENIP